MAGTRTGTGPAPVLRAGPAPHWTSLLRRRHINLAVVLGLLPAVTAATWVHGWGALGRLALAAGAAVLVELYAARAMRQPVRIHDLSAVAEGLLLALLLPPTAPAWLILVGVVVMVVVGKQLFGGTGGYPINPVLIGWAVLLLSWGNRIHPVGEAGLLGTAWLPSVWIGGVAILVLGHVRVQAPLGMLVGVLLTSWGFHEIYPEVPIPADQIATGSVVLGAFFLSTDSPTSPANSWARLLYGLFAGAIVVVLRTWGVWPEPVPFALLLANVISPLLDRARPRALRRVTSHA